MDMTNTPSGAGRQTLSMSREAVPNSNHCIRVGADRDGAEFCCANDAVVDGRNAHIAVIQRRPSEQVKSTHSGRSRAGGGGEDFWARAKSFEMASLEYYGKLWNDLAKRTPSSRRLATSAPRIT